MSKMIYMDYNATAPMSDATIEAWNAAAKVAGNASSVHAAGREAAKIIEVARSQVAALVDTRPRDVVFTSGGTEGNNAIIRMSGAKRLILSSVEHDSVLAAAALSDVSRTTINVDDSGALNLKELEEALKAAPHSTLVSVMLVNNETGIIQDMAPITALTKEYGARLHVDAIQAAGKIDICIKDLGADYITLSAHKIGGPQGIGAVILSPTAPLQPLVVGGGQELGRRSGTENVAGIAGFGAAAMEAFGSLIAQGEIALLRDHIEAEITHACPDVQIIKGDHRVANTSCIALKGVSGETQVMHFDLAGICISSGSACSSGKVKTSHVLTAMGYDEELAKASIRVSLGAATTKDDVEAFIAAYKKLYERTAGRR